LTQQAAARRALPEIRRKETLAAGRILGIGKHYFLDQKDAGFTLDPNEGPRQLWDTDRVLSVLTKLLAGGKYQFVLTLRPRRKPTDTIRQLRGWLSGRSRGCRRKLVPRCLAETRGWQPYRHRLLP
jgi:LmbE family N-acetylglucosaminyl deacetylase